MGLKEILKRDLPIYLLFNLHVLTSCITITGILMLVQSVLPDVRIPEREERRLPKQRNSQKKGSLLLT